MRSGYNSRTRHAAPSIFRPLVTRSSEYTYTPAWWVPGAHLQTLWGQLMRRPPVIVTRAVRLATPDGDEIELRRLDPEAGRASPLANPPRLLLLHGLEGTVNSSYIRGALAEAHTRGWAADVLIFRTCNGEMNRARRMYHSGETSDLDLVIRHLVGAHPDQRLLLAGFSLGGNVLLKWLGERGDDVPEQVVAAAAVSVPFDLERGARRIERGFSRFYGRHFLRSLRAKARAKLASYPDLFDVAGLDRARTIFDFDEAVTAPVHGFRSASDYYSQSSAIHFLLRIQRSTLLLSSYDDPFLPSEILDSVAKMAQSNHCIEIEFHSHGGHVGFVNGRAPRYFAESRVTEFLEDSLVLPLASRRRPQHLMEAEDFVNYDH